MRILYCPALSPDSFFVLTCCNHKLKYTFFTCICQCYGGVSHKSFQTSKEFELSVGVMDQSRLVSDIKMSVYILQMSKIDYNYNSEGGLQ